MSAVDKSSGNTHYNEVARETSSTLKARAGGDPGRLYSIPVENLGLLVKALKEDFPRWDGTSSSLAKIFTEKKIDPIHHPRYSRFYKSTRHTLAASYQWGGTLLQAFAEECSKPLHAGKLIWIDVLITKQFDVDSSGVVALTVLVYKDCEVLIMLSEGIFIRGWCLYEALIYILHGCKLHTVGTCQQVQGKDFFRDMVTFKPEDKTLIQDQIKLRYGADCEAKFNRSVEDAIVAVYAESLLAAGQYQKAEEILEKRLAAQKARGDNKNLQADTLLNIGRAYDGLGQYDKALQPYSEAVSIYQDGNNHVSVAATKKNIGIVYRKQGKYEAALKNYEEALAIEVKCLGNDHVSVASTKNNIATVYDSLGKYEEALKTYEEALEIKIKCLGNDHVSVANTKNNIGMVHDSLGKYEEALKTYEEALTIYINCLGNDHVSVSDTKNNIAMVYDSLGRYEEALKMYEEALDITIKCLGNDHVSVAATKKNIGIVYKNQGKYEAALKNYEEALAIEVKCLGNDHVSVANTTKNIGIVHGKQGDRAKAKDCYVKAHSIYLKALGPDHPSTKGLVPYI